MPIIKDTSSGINEQYEVPLDIADASKTTLTPSGFTEVTAINQGTFSGNYQYDIVSTQSTVGNAYAAINSSAIQCHSSVALFSRNNAFSATRDSSAEINNCAAHIAYRGISTIYSSSGLVQGSVLAICDTSYHAANSSSLLSRESASVFPLRYGVDVVQSSSFNGLDHESMTFNWNSANTYLVPTHFRSLNNSYCANTSYAITTRGFSAGISGSIVSSRPLNFAWSQIATSISAGTTTASNILGNPAASYRFVPFSHSIDYSNAVASTVSNASALSTTGLLSIISKERFGYSSVKPPSQMFKPEDNSGSTAIGGGLTGDFSVFELITSL